MGAGRVIGIGGVFLKSSDRAQLSAWYSNHLGIEQNEYGAIFKWRSFEKPDQENVTAWNIFPADTRYFEPGTAPFMINYIVDDLDSLA